MRNAQTAATRTSGRIVSIETIGIVGPGDMGHNVGRTLREEAGLRVVTALDGRSTTSRERAARAKIEDVGDLASFVREADLILSIMPPTQAAAFARAISLALEETGEVTPFAECNPLAPQNVQAIAASFKADAPFVDAGIVVLPPGTSAMATRFYVSGPHRDLLEPINCESVVVKPAGEALGAASAVKMCYAALNKGTVTLRTAVLVAAVQLGVGEVFQAEVAASQKGHWEAMNKVIPWYAKDSIRQMVEIQKTFAAVGVTPNFHKGAEELYDLLARTPLTEETRETEDRSRSLDEAIRIFAAAIQSDS